MQRMAMRVRSSQSSPRVISRLPRPESCVTARGVQCLRDSLASSPRERTDAPPGSLVVSSSIPAVPTSSRLGGAGSDTWHVLNERTRALATARGTAQRDVTLSSRQERWEGGDGRTHSPPSIGSRGGVGGGRGRLCARPRSGVRDPTRPGYRAVAPPDLTRCRRRWPG